MGQETPKNQEGRKSARRRRGEGRVLAYGLGVSAALHLLLALVFSSGESPIRFMIPAFPVVFEERAADGIQVVQIAEVASEPGDDPDDPTIIEELEAPDEEVEFESLDEDRSPERAVRYRSAGERLRAGQGDERLWRGIDPSLVELSDVQGAQLRILTAIEAMNDSAAAAAERDRRATDWSFTDDDGDRWGVSPGKLHLGKISIPLPFGFAGKQDINGEAGRRAYDNADIDRAAGTRAVQESYKERREAMRLRREARRVREQAEAIGRKTTSPPDTTRRRR